MATTEVGDGIICGTLTVAEPFAHSSVEVIIEAAWWVYRRLTAIAAGG